MDVRGGEARDLAQINEIYNHYVVHTPATFDLEPITMAQRRAWFADYGSTGRYRLVVARQRDRLLGYATASRFLPRLAYNPTVATTAYVAPGELGGGVGSALYAHLFEVISTEDVHRAVAGITLPNEASVALHHRFGFEEVGVFREVGRKFDRYWDVAWFSKEL